MDKNEPMSREIEKLRHQVTVLKALHGTAPIGLLLVDSGSEAILYYNEAFLRVWGIGHLKTALDRGELNSRDITAQLLSLVSDPPGLAALYERVRQAGRQAIYNHLIWLADGRCIRLNSSQVVEHGGQLKGWVYSFEDITPVIKAEEEARKSNERYKELADLLPQIVYEIDLAGNLTFVNQSAYEVSGYTEEDFKRGLNVLDMLVTEDRERGIRNIQSVLNGDKSGYEYTLTRKDGSRYPVIIHSSVILRDGKPVGLRGIIIDVTVQKREEERLLLTQASIDNFTDSCIWMDMNLNIRQVNDATCRSLGYTREELLKLNIRDIDALFTEELGRKIASEMKKNSFYRFESIRKAKDGRLFPVEISCKYLLQGNVGHVISFERDITERKLAERKLSDNLQFLQTLIDMIPVPVFYKDVNERYIGCNVAFEKFFGRSKEDIIGKTAYDINPDELAENTHRYDAVLLSAGTSQSYENSVMHADGSIHTVINYKTLFNGIDGRVGGIVGAMIDITERKSYEERIKNSLREKEVLLKEVHHRVKNNMQIISSLLSLQLSGVDQEPVKQKLAESQSRIRSIALVHERMYMSDDLSRIDFTEYLRSLASHLLVTYNSRSGQVNLIIEGDTIRLGVDQAVPCGLIMNELISNSLKHAFPVAGHGTIRIHLRGNGHNKVILEDDGIGIPDSFSLSDPRSMGMQLVVALVDQLEGQITLDSSSGTRFTITFPAR